VTTDHVMRVRILRGVQNGQREVPPLIKMEYRIFTKRKRVIYCSCKNDVGTKLTVRS
jgi:hypothetical protein